jgi:hypothetical protein
MLGLPDRTEKRAASKDNAWAVSCVVAAGCRRPFDSLVSSVGLVRSRRRRQDHGAIGAVRIWAVALFAVGMVRGASVQELCSCAFAATAFRKEMGEDDRAGRTRAAGLPLGTCAPWPSGPGHLFASHRPIPSDRAQGSESSREVVGTPDPGPVPSCRSFLCRASNSTRQAAQGRRVCAAPAHSNDQ